MQFSFLDIFEHMGVPAMVVAGILLVMGMATLTVFMERLITLRRSRLASRRFAALAATGLRDGQIDAVLQASALNDETFSAYVDLNGQFHKQLSEMADSAVLAREIERASSLPFASASGFVGVHVNDAHARDTLVVAQHQHRQVLDAIERREAGRAEAIMREHSRIARQNMQVALRDPAASGTPGVQLIRPS